MMQQPLNRAITDYQDGHLSLEQLRLQIEHESQTPDGMRAIRSLLDSANQSLPRSVRRLLTDVSIASPTVTYLRPSPIGVGSVLNGRYRLIREIGRGGMGAVYLAEGVVDLQQFAVKVLNSEFLQHPDALRIFREEARKSLTMRHPNIVAVYPLECDAGHYYLPMEYLEGKTIRELLDQDFARGVPLDQAWPIVKAAGAALAFAHDQGVVHSDLKPSNIFVTTGGRLRVLDFGIARLLRDRRYFDTDSLGAMTAAYASCEMLAREPPDFRDDVYAFACVVYELLTGKHPFSGLTAAEARSRRMVVAPIRGLTPAQNLILRRGLAFHCDDRTSTIEEFLGICGTNAASLAGPHTATPAEVTLPDDAGLRFCAVCGKELPTIARFCPGCGAPADTEVTDSGDGELQVRCEYRPGVQKDKPPVSGDRVKVFWAAGIVAAVAIGLLALYAVRSSRSPGVGPTPPALQQRDASPTDGPRGPDLTVAPAVPGNTAQEQPTVVTAAAALPDAPLTSDAVASSAGISPDAAALAPPSIVPPTIRPDHSPAHGEDIEHPPIGKHVSAFKLAEDSPQVQDCEYPAAAREAADTGTVLLLVYVAADGSLAKTAVESSSDSKLLDDAAVDCVNQLHFVPKRIAGTAVGSWARVRFKWSIGD